MGWGLGCAKLTMVVVQAWDVCSLSLALLAELGSTAIALCQDVLLPFTLDIVEGPEPGTCSSLPNSAARTRLASVNTVFQSKRLPAAAQAEGEGGSRIELHPPRLDERQPQPVRRRHAQHAQDLADRRRSLAHTCGGTAHESDNQAPPRHTSALCCLPEARSPAAERASPTAAAARQAGAGKQQERAEPAGQRGKPCHHK
jgi:hypothetical protein